MRPGMKWLIGIGAQTFQRFSFTELPLIMIGHSIMCMEELKTTTL